jgi:predicted phage tail protein
MASSVASSRIRNLRAAQNALRMRSEEAVQTARLAQDLIDEEERELEEPEAAEDNKLILQYKREDTELILQYKREDAELILQAAKAKAKSIRETVKAKANMSRARREVERKSFEIEATRSETLAQIEDDYINDQGSSHGLDS